MFNPVDLFKQRLKEHIKLLNRYLRYIFNGHFMIALLFIIITLAIYYQQWLRNMSDDFPGLLIMALIFGILVSYNPIQSFLKEPDKVFLIVKEEKMHRYFRLTLFYNFCIQLYLVFIVTAGIAPLYGQVFPEKGSLDYLLLVLIILIVKGWNLLINWYMFKIRNRSIRMFDSIVRTLISIGLFYFFMLEELFVIIVVLYFVIILHNYMLARRQSGLAWDQLIENDQNRLAFFYRFVSMFADVPHFKKRLRKRRILSSFINRIVAFEHRFTYDYLYRLTFIRSSDYVSMYIRLTIIGWVIIVFVPNDWLKILFAILFIYMTSFQMITLYHHYRTNMWLDLYPIEESAKQKAFLKWMVQLSSSQTILFAVIFIFWLDFISFGIVLIMGLLFSYFFHHLYVKRKISTR